MYELLGHGFKLKQPPTTTPTHPWWQKGTKWDKHLFLWCHTMALPFTTLKSILKQKEELWKLKYGNSPYKNIIFKQIPLKETKILQDIVTLELNFKFQHKAKYHL
jgi:hypothetical protein